MTYNFNIKTKDLSGKEEGERTLTEVLCEFIGSEGKGNTIKLCYWYAELLAKRPLELDEPDKSYLIDLIEKSERLWVFIKHQLLSVLNKK